MLLRFLELAQLQANQDADESSVMQYQARISIVLLCIISGYLCISLDISRQLQISLVGYLKTSGAILSDKETMASMYVVQHNSKTHFVFQESMNQYWSVMYNVHGFIMTCCC